MKRLFLAALINLLTVHLLTAQTAAPFTSDRWQFTPMKDIQDAKEHVTEDYLGKPSLRLRNCDAVLNDVDLTNGTIEYDLAFSPGRSFIFLMFRMQDPGNHESFYIRPHQSGNPDATQYMPVFNGKESWQLYHGEGYSAPVTFAFQQWTPVKLVIADSQMEVFIGDMTKPALFVPQFKRSTKGGKVGISCMGAACHFANFRYTATDKLPITSVAKPPVPSPTGTILDWQISEPFSEKKLANVFRLTSNETKNMGWQSIKAESTGLVNLASGITWSEANNTTFARLVVDSDRQQIKSLQLGFSDRVRVYLNNNLLYSGHDEFMSRDYRFLGTVGYYDEVYLPLKKGRNELWIAISESFGGWGLKGLIADQTGLTIQTKPDDSNH